MTTMIDKILILGAVSSGLIFIGCLVAARYYDPEIEVYPGRTMPRSLMKKMDYMGGIGSDGKWHEWVAENPLWLPTHLVPRI